MIGSRSIRWIAAALAIFFVSPILAEQKQRPGRQQRSRRQAADQVKEGQMAPDFQLETVDGRRKVRLSSFKKKKPVALIFGSYT